MLFLLRALLTKKRPFKNFLRIIRALISLKKCIPAFKYLSEYDDDNYNKTVLNNQIITDNNKNVTT